jgi:hypothetical protein
MLKSWERKYFRNNEGSKYHIWQEGLALTVTDEGAVVVDHDWDQKHKKEPEPEKQTVLKPDERKKVRNRREGTWILIDVYE